MTIKIITVVYCLLSPGLTFAGMDSCVSLASTLKEYNISNQSSAFLNSVFDQYCDQSGSTKSSGGGIGLEAVVKAIPIKFTGTYSSNEDAFKNFCKNYSSIVSSSERKYTYEEKIATKSLETIDSCLRIAATGAVVTHEIPNSKSVVFYLQSSAATKLELKGVFPIPDDGLICKGHIDSQLKNINEETDLKIDSSLGVSCSRVPKNKGNGEVVLEEQVITLATNLGNYTVFLPQDEQLPLKMAQDISTRLDKAEFNGADVSSKVSSLQVEMANEKNAVKYLVVSNGDNCPDGWSNQGIIGWIMKKEDYANNIGVGAEYNEGWNWTHPKLCKR